MVLRQDINNSDGTAFGDNDEVIMNLIMVFS